MDQEELLSKLFDLANEEFICSDLLQSHGLNCIEAIEALFTEEYIDYISREEALDASLPEDQKYIMSRCRTINRERSLYPAIEKELKDKYTPASILTSIEAYKLILRRRNKYVLANSIRKIFNGITAIALSDLMKQHQVLATDTKIATEKIKSMKECLAGAVTVKQAATILNVTERTIYLKARKLGVEIMSYGMSADNFQKIRTHMIGEPGAVTVKQAATILNVTERTIYLKARKLGVEIMSYGMSADNFQKIRTHMIGEPGAVTVKQAATILNVTERTIYLKARKLGVEIMSYGMSADNFQKIRTHMIGEPGAVTVKQAATILNVTERTIYLKARKLGVEIMSYGMSADNFQKIRTHMIGEPGAVTVKQAATILNVTERTVQLKARKLGVEIMSYGMSADNFQKIRTHMIGEPGAVTVKQAATILNVTERTVQLKARKLGVEIMSYGMSADDFRKVCYVTK